MLLAAASGEAETLAAQSRLALLLGDDTAAHRLLHEAVATAQAIDYRYGAADALAFSLAGTLVRLGQPDRARPYLLQAAGLFEQMELGDRAERLRQTAGA